MKATNVKIIIKVERSTLFPKKLMSRAIEIIYAGPNQHNGEFMAWYPPIAVGTFYVCVHLVLYMLLYIILFLKRWMAKIVVQDSLRHYIL